MLVIIFIDSYDHVDCTTVSENQAYKQSLIDILEYDKKSKKKKISWNYDTIYSKCYIYDKRTNWFKW